MSVQKMGLFLPTLRSQERHRCFQIRALLPTVIGLPGTEALTIPEMVICYSK